MQKETHGRDPENNCKLLPLSESNCILSSGFASILMGSMENKLVQGQEFQTFLNKSIPNGHFPMHFPYTGHISIFYCINQSSPRLNLQLKSKRMNQRYFQLLLPEKEIKLKLTEWFTKKSCFKVSFGFLDSMNSKHSFY